MTSATPSAGDREDIRLSIVSAALDEERNVGELHRAIARALDPLGFDWELILVDDGSADGTWEEIRALNALDGRVRGIRFSRNFGHQSGLLAGIAEAEGDAVVTIDADLQQPPEVIPALVAEWRKGFQVVHTIREDTRDLPFLKRAVSRLYYRIFSFLSGIDVRPGMADFRLLDRQVVESLLQFGEGGLFLRGLVQWMGFPSTHVRFRSAPRVNGASRYSWRRMLKLGWTGISAFSLVPLRLASATGLLTSGLAFLALVYAAGSKLLGLATMPGWASALSITALLFGILFVLVGVLGEYLGRILVEVKARPRYLVRERVGGEPGRASAADPTRTRQGASPSAAASSPAEPRVVTPRGGRATLTGRS